MNNLLRLRPTLVKTLSRFFLRYGIRKKFDLSIIHYRQIKACYICEQGRAVATGGCGGCNTPPDDCSYEQFHVNSGRFAEEIQVNQRKFR